MKVLLPTLSSHYVRKTGKGFTLIELLVVIAIIAVLSVMGMATYSGLTGKGNDDRRRADLKAISDALEVAKGVKVTYQTITVDAFSAGVVPSEPARRTANTPKYCYTDGTSVIGNPAPWTGNDCPAAGSGNLTPWTPVGGTVVPPVNTNATIYRICGMAEDNSVICFGSRQ